MGSQRNILNLKWKTMRSLSVWIYVCLSVCLLFFDNIAEVINEFLFNWPKEK